MTTATYSSLSQGLETLQLSSAAPGETAGPAGADVQTLSGGQASFMLALLAPDFHGSLLDDLVIGEFHTYDSTAQNFTYELLDDVGGCFKVVGNELWVANGAAITPGLQSITVRVRDEKGLSLTQVVEFRVRPIGEVPGETPGNHAPTDLALSGTSVDENAGNDTVVGTLSATDPEGAPLTYTLLDDAAGRFKIVGNQVVVADGSKLDHEALASHSIRVRVKDQGGSFSDKTFAIHLNDLADGGGAPENHAPSGLIASGLGAFEHAATDTVVGNLAVYDRDVNEEFTFTLLDDAGGRFKIVGSQVLVADSSKLVHNPDPLANRYYITIKVTDHGGLSRIEQHSIDVISADTHHDNLNPRSVEISNTLLREDAPEGTVVGTLFGLDDGGGETFTYSLLDNAQGLFALDATGTKLVVADHTKLDYERNAQPYVTVRVWDSHGAYYDQTLYIEVQNVAGDQQTAPEDHAPKFVNHTRYSVAEHASTGTVIDSLLAYDPDGGNVTYTLLANSEGRFRLDGNKIVVADGARLDQGPYFVTVKVMDADGQWRIKAFSITALRDYGGGGGDTGNHAPTDVTLSNATVAENSTDGTVVGLLGASDPDPNESFTYVLLDDAGGRFRIVDNKIVVSGPLDYEAAHSHNVTVRVKDAHGASYDKTLTIQVTDIKEGDGGGCGGNHAPTDITLSNATIAENSAEAAIVGTFTATDPDAGESFTYVLLDNAGGRFKIVDNNLVVNGPLDYEAAHSHNVTVRVKDAHGGSYDKTFTIAVTDVDEGGCGGGNHAPVDIALTRDFVDENAANGTLVGSLKSIDPENDAVTYRLLDDAGGRFRIEHDANGAFKLVVADGSRLNYEQATSYNVVVEAKDVHGAAYAQTLTIHLNNVNEAPYDLKLWGDHVDENSRGGVAVGALTSFDPEGDAITYTLLNDADGRFNLVGNWVVVAAGANLDYEAAHSHSITVRVTDSHGGFIDRSFNIHVNDVAEDGDGGCGGGNHAPTDIVLSNDRVAENSPQDTVIGTLRAVDPDGGNLFSYMLLDDAGDRFRLEFDGNGGAKLMVRQDGVLDYETAHDYTIRVVASDVYGATFAKSFTIHVTDVDEGSDGDGDGGTGNHAPTDIELSNATIKENAETGSLIGLLSATDPDAGETFTYALLDDAGGRFRLDAQGTGIEVANGSLLDFEDERSHTVSVKVTDAHGATFTKSLVIHLADVFENDDEDDAGSDGEVHGSLGDDVLIGGEDDDVIIGGAGRDVLTGGKGSDVFVFDTRPVKKANVDVITDFSVRDDTIQLARSVFTKAGKAGVLKKDAFFVGAKAHDASDRIVYDKKTGAVFYDDDGSGQHAAVQIAQLSKNLKVTEKDFFIV